jgi:hypothetical protein
MVNLEADFVTGVSSNALKRFDNPQQRVVYNGLMGKAEAIGLVDDVCDYGFIGFITDKFDIELLEKLLLGDHSRVVLYGEVLDSSLYKRLSEMKNVKLQGRFAGSDVPKIMKTFRVGLLPYRFDKSHDGSPLKLYEYLNYGKPVISSTDYEIQSEFIHVFRDLQGLNQFLEKYLFVDRKVAKKIQSTLAAKDFWDSKISSLLDQLGSIVSSKQ